MPQIGQILFWNLEIACLLEELKNFLAITDAPDKAERERLGGQGIVECLLRGGFCLASLVCVFCAATPKRLCSTSAFRARAAANANIDRLRSASTTI